MASGPASKFPEIPGYVFDAFLGEGATGQVFRATHGDRPVAIKVLKRLGVNRNLIGYSLTRLRNLPQHPNLVEIVSFAMEGRPLYIAMALHTRVTGEGERSEGFSLDALCGQMDPTLAWVMIRQICQGMAHLHKHGVLHCSLNPKNVLVADPDLPLVKLTDFGQGWMSEISHIDFSESFLHAPPEQLREPQAMFEGQGQRWDVYAFGVTAYRLLYEQYPRGQDWIESLLAGNVPFHPHAFADVVSGEPEVPWPESPDPFEQRRLQLLERCLMLDPKERYNDLREVLDDFETIDREEKHAIEQQQAEERERVLSEKLVASHQRLGRFRLAAFCLLIALIVSAVLNVTSETRLIKRRQEMKRLRTDSERLLGESKRSELKAKDEAVRLKSNLTYSQATADAFLDFLLNANNPNAPEYESIESYLNSARQHYERVLRSTRGDKVFVVERLRAQLGLARIELQLGEAETALPKLQALLDEIELLPEGVSQSLEVQETLGSALLAMGKAKIAAGLRDEALATLQESVKVYNKQLSAAPQNLQLKRKSGKALFYYGQQLSRSGDLKNALKRQQSAMQVLEELAQSANALPEDEYFLALCQFEVGLIRVWENQGIEAFQAFQLASRGYSRLMDEKPHVPEYRFQLARCLFYLGDLSFQEKGDEEDSALARNSMRELLLLLLQRDEANRDYQFYLALVLIDLAEMARDAGEREAAAENLDQALAILTELHKAVPANADMTFHLALAKAAQGDFLLDSDQKAEAIQQLTEAEALLQAIAADPEVQVGVPDHVFRFRRAGVLGGLGHALEVNGQAAEAAEQFRRAQTILRDLVAGRPNDGRLRDALAAIEGRTPSSP